ncbi:MAG: hypothetical protein WA948_07510 [Pontixanthobacter sp.]
MIEAEKQALKWIAENDDIVRLRQLATNAKVGATEVERAALRRLAIV